MQRQNGWMLQLGEQWLASRSAKPLDPIQKSSDTTQAWFVEIGGVELFAKLYPTELIPTWGEAERKIAGANLHSCIVPITQVVEVQDGQLFLYRLVDGDNLGGSDVRARFMRLPVTRRAMAVVSTIEALAAICNLGFAVVDWYEGNMIFDFERDRLWLFDWELCRPGRSFVLEMESNYGSSRLMAPEEFVRGSVIDEQTLVFNLGRFALLYLPEWAEPLAAVLAKATYPARAGRYRTVDSLLAALRSDLPSD